MAAGTPELFPLVSDTAFPPPSSSASLLPEPRCLENSVRDPRPAGALCAHKRPASGRLVCAAQGVFSVLRRGGGRRAGLQGRGLGQLLGGCAGYSGQPAGSGSSGSGSLGGGHAGRAETSAWCWRFRPLCPGTVLPFLCFVVSSDAAALGWGQLEKEKRASWGGGLRGWRGCEE